MKNSRLWGALIGALMALTAALPVLAQPELCEGAARSVARETGVPESVLLAITLTETGRRAGGRLRPWPWAANGAGQGHWFDTRAEALAYARRSLAQGRQSFDLGCFQINWRWHGEAFGDVSELLDPVVAGRYAARLLRRYRDELGSWEAAAGAYHSRTPRLAARYRARFAQVLAGLGDGPLADGLDAPGMIASRAQPDTPDATPFPLFTGTARGPSLVPAALPGRRPFIEARP